MPVAKLIWKNLLRHKLRTALTVLGIAVAVLAFGLLRTVVSAWYAGVEASAQDRLITRHAVSFIFTLPYSYRDKIEVVPGVTKISFANWFGGIYIDQRQFFPRFAVDTETFFDVYPEFLLSRAELDAFKKDRNSCVIGKKIAERYSLKVGNIIPLTGDIYPGQWEFVIRAIYAGRDKSTDETQMLFHWKNLDERIRQEMPGREGGVGWYIVSIDNPDHAADVSDAIDGLFSNSRAETKTETERAFQLSFVSMSSEILASMEVLSYIIIGIILLVLANTMVMAERERTTEYAVLRTLGFSKGFLAAVIGGESLLIALIGGGIGIAVTFPIVRTIAHFVSNIFPVFNVELSTIIMAISSAVAAGSLAAAFPVHRAANSRIVDVLRQIE
ncbi:MAG TPA: FtsX-like permease family protein [Bacteroidota bacterium]